VPVAIINYGAGNLDSVGRAVAECGAQPVITSDPADLFAASHIILPGVGAFCSCMAALRARGFEPALNEQVLGQGVPFLGICLGMQLLATRGTEGGSTPGLGWIEGDVVRLPAKDGSRIPHVGWNEVHQEQSSPFFEGIKTGTDFYFVHSYHLACSNRDQVLARTPYCGGFVSAVRRDNIVGVQFHPEKSQGAGMTLYRNFLSPRWPSKR
jgi:glutamine amidotransferase